jgi:hypothetical protein
MRILDIISESQHICPYCGGPLLEDTGLQEKKDACYHKIKASAKVWPSAYASGRLVQCRKKGAANYGKKSEDIGENFADGKNPQDKGDSKRHGINTKASVSSLRKTAKQGGRKGQLAHWLANMKAGRAKKNK